MHRSIDDKGSEIEDRAAVDLDADELRSVVGRRIVLARRRMGWSQRRLAAELGIPSSTVSRYENGVFVPRLKRLIAISIALGTTTDYLYGLTREPGAGRPE